MAKTPTKTTAPGKPAGALAKRPSANTTPLIKVGEQEPGYGQGAATQPEMVFEQKAQPTVLAPWPHIDRFPLIIGSNLTFQHINSALREAIGGYRDRFVDVLGELLDQEPHGFSQLFKRVVSVVGGHLEINPVDVEDAEAVEIAEAYRKQHETIPNVTAALSRLAWAIFYGIAGEEILWTRSGEWRWTIAGLQMIHSRRLSYPDWMNWDLWVWDGGALNPGKSPVGGLRVKDFPNKFVTHVAQLRADYPTREGLGRILCVYFALKRLILRVTAAEFERFVKPWVLAYFNTGIDGNPRPALEEDKEAVDKAIKALGQGYSTSAVLPDSVKVELVAAVTSLDRDALLEYFDSSITRAVNGQSLTASQGKSGSRAANEVGERDEQRIHRYDAKMLCDTWHEQVIKPWVRLNFPGKEHLAPVISINVEEAPDAKSVLDEAGAATDLGIEVDAEHVAKRAKLPIAKAGAKKLERPKPELPPGMGNGPPGKAKGANKAPGKAGAKPAPKAGKGKPPAKDKNA